MKKVINYIIESIVELKQILFGSKEAVKDTIGGLLIFAGFIALWIVCAGFPR